MAWGVLIAMGVSAAYNAYQQHESGQAAKKVGTAQEAAANDAADISDYNAQVADEQAADATARGTEQENKFRAGVRGIIGTQRAGFAGNGVDVGFGSSVDVQGDAAYLGELDALQIRTNAAREAWGYQVQAEDLRKSAAVQRKTGQNAALAGQNAATAANYQAVGTVIGGATSLLTSRYGFGRTAATTPSANGSLVGG